METPEINAIEMTRHIRDGHYEQIQDKTREDRIAFYRAKAHALLQEHQASTEPSNQADPQHRS